MTNTMITERDLAARLGCSVGKLRADRRRGAGIPYLKFGKLVRYRASDVDAWIAGATVGGVGV